VINWFTGCSYRASPSKKCGVDTRSASL